MVEASLNEKLVGVFGFLMPACLIALAIITSVWAFILTIFGVLLFVYFGLPWLRTYFEAYATEVVLKVIKKK